MDFPFLSEPLLRLVLRCRECMSLLLYLSDSAVPWQFGTVRHTTVQFRAHLVRPDSSRSAFACALAEVLKRHSSSELYRGVCAHSCVRPSKVRRENERTSRIASGNRKSAVTN